MIPPARRRVAVLLSGGLDSTVLASHALDLGLDVVALGVDYGQAHVRELAHATQVAEVLGVPFRVVDLSGLGRHLDSTLTTGHGSKVVPGRNAVLVDVAVAYALAHDLDTVALAVNACDARDFPDCHPTFLDLLDRVLRYQGLNLWTPFTDKTKGMVARLGLDLGSPVHLSWSCYRSGPRPCGACEACRDRARAVPGERL